MNKRPMTAYVFYCSSNLEAGQLTGLDHRADAIKRVSLPCSGKVDLPYLMKAFETGADGVAIVTCKKNECRHFEGNLRAHKRAEGVEALLEEIGVGKGRVAVFECGPQDAGTVADQVSQFIEQLRNLPPMHPSSTQSKQPQGTTA
jgi:F420-non-reducing hydrogenase iron-sulfur subunit